MKRGGVVLYVFIIVVSNLWAGPFGVEMGWTFDDLEQNGFEPIIVSQNYNSSNITIFPTKAHPDFSLYFVSLDDLKGVYQIYAANMAVKTSMYGNEIRTLHKKIKEQVSSTYGTPEETDYLLPESMWDEPGDWMMALVRGERYLGADWDCKGKDNIQSISLFVTAETTNSAILILVYDSIYTTDVKSRLDANASSVF